MRDAALVVGVVDDRDLVLREVRFDPPVRELPQLLQGYAVVRVRGHHEVLEGPRPHAAPFLVGAVRLARVVHLDVPLDRDGPLAPLLADPFVTQREVENVPAKRPVLLLKIGAQLRDRPVTGYRLQDRHGYASMRCFA